MNELTAERLVAINRTFYRRFASAFDETRTGAWPGWHRILDAGPPRHVLDLGCGNGRFGRFLASQHVDAAYEGWDDNAELLARAQTRMSHPGESAGRASSGDAEAKGARPLDRAVFREVDLLEPSWPSASADLVVLFGVMHHVPTFERRRALLQRALARVASGGRLVVCFWQFAPEGEPRVAVAPWAEAGIEPSDVDPGDFLVRWRRGGQGLRYCHHCRPADIDALVAHLDADTVDHFKSDGASADLNMYVTLRPKHSRKP